MTPRRVNGLLALEQDAVLAAPEDPVWLPSASGPATDLRNALDQLRPGGEIPVEAPPSAALMPEDSDTNTAPALPVLLRPAEKRALDLIFDWPWMSRTELASLMVVSTRRVSQIVNPLEGFGLVTRPIKSSGRLALTDRGIALLARRDRTSVAVARRRWSVALQDGDAPCEWRNVSGGRTRQLLRNVQHTDAVHAFIASLARQANTLGWQVVQIDPPKRASRHFRHEGRRRSVNPDAFGLLGRGPAAWAFFLEWERRAVRPSTMATRLAPYLRYYSSHGPIDDHGSTARRPHRLRRRPGRSQLPESGPARDKPHRRRRAPVGIPQGGNRVPGAAGKDVEDSPRLGTRPRPAEPMNPPERGGSGAAAPGPSRKEVFEP